MNIEWVFNHQWMAMMVTVEGLIEGLALRGMN